MQPKSRGVWALGYAFGFCEAESVPGPLLVDLLRELGMAEPAVRTMLSRMTRSGQLTAEKHGRVASYRLSGPYRERFLRIRHRDDPLSWTGSFQLVVYDIDEARRRDRDALRDRALAAGFGLARPGMLIGFSDPTPWCQPWVERDDLFVRVGELACTVEVATDLVDRAWKLGETGSEITQFISRLSATGLESPARSFVLLSEIMRDYAYLAIPAVPAEIISRDWPGRLLPAALSRATSQLEPGAREHAQSVATARGLTGLIESRLSRKSHGVG